MSAYLLRRILFLPLAALSLLGCVDDPTEEQESSVRQIEQAVLIPPATAGASGSPADCNAGLDDGKDCDTNGDLCDGEVCQPDGSCQDPDPGNDKDCSGFDPDANDCKVWTCNAGSGVCEEGNANNGADCDDGLFCNGDDTCNPGGQCNNHAGDPCSGGGQCDDTCDEAADTCNLPAGTACDDNIFCNGTDTCDGAGACDNHTGDPCTGGGQCDDTCDEAGDTCDLPAGTACDDNVFCNGADTCDGSGACDNHAGDPCAGGGQCDDTCDEAGDTCDLPAGTACDDNLFCNGTDTCDGAGACDNHTGDPCAGGGQCDDTCDEAGDTCDLPAGTACDDNVFCNGADTCDGSGACDNHAGDPCAGGGQCDDTCDEAGDTCDLPAGTACDDNLFCNGADTCDGAGACDNHTGDPCAGGGQCDDTCDEAGDTCDLPAGTACDDNVFCNGADTCDGSGACDNHAGDPCTGGGQCDDTCDEAGDTCDLPAGTACDDNLFCNGTDTCDGAGACGTHTGDPCAGGGQCDDTCDEAGDTCDLPAGTACDDGTFCNGDDTCNGAGACNVHAGNPCHNFCQACNDGTDSCDNINETLDCAQDGLFCTGREVCTAGACVSQGDPCAGGDACNNDCDDVADDCFTDAGTTCDDGIFCTQTDQCNGTGTCVGSGNPCGAADFCGNWCTDNPAATTCNRPDGTDCEEGNLCSPDDTCNGIGTCVAAGTVSCTDGNNLDCIRPICNPSSGLCTLTENWDNPSCSDGFPCTENDSCTAGVCSGTPNNDICDLGECVIGRCDTGAGCQFDYATQAGTVCRPAAVATQPGTVTCDIAERCPADNATRQQAACPVNEFQPAGFVCRDASCADGIQQDPVECVGDAFCPTIPADVECVGDDPVLTEPGFACDTSGDPPVCRISCDNDTHCLSSHYCDPSDNNCKPRVGIGNPCDSDIECSDSAPHCVDGVCCDRLCTGQCESCRTGTVGVCETVPFGSDVDTGVEGGPRREPCIGADVPAAERTNCAGVCEGSPSSCSYAPAGVACADARCDTDTNEAVENSECNGSGSCNPPAPVSCAPFICQQGTALCRTDCTLDSHCQGTQQCNAGVCEDLYGDGVRCTNNNQCENGNCVDGYCCESTCSGQCEACNIAGSEGDCTPVPAGEVPVAPRPDCTGEGTECGGTCDGTNRNACSYPATERECRSASCADGEATIAGFCDGSGSCPPAVTVTCGADGCLENTAFCADGECADDSRCADNPDGPVCLAGVCTPERPNGEACALDSHCESGSCVDGVCCDTACDGQCEACNLTDSLGTCAAIPAGELPRGGRPACLSDNTECGGTCDGTNTDSCNYPADISCRSASCASGEATLAATCDGSGACPDIQLQDCGTDGCVADGDLCDGDCADGSACPDGEYCSAGACVPLIGIGEVCGDDSQCGSGNCVDGFCCNTACEGQCAACDVADNEGTCSAVSGPPRNGRQACPGSGACAGVCDGTNSDSCSFPGSDTPCGDATCVDGVVTQEATCNGEGACADGETTACKIQLCNEDGTPTCAAECTEDFHCLGSKVCLSGRCEDNPFINAEDQGSCGCKLPGDPTPAGGTTPLLILALPLLLAWRRRRLNRAVS